MRSRDYFKRRVAARIDEAIPDSDTVGGQTAIEDPHAFADDELDYSLHHILQIASIEHVLPSAKSDLLHFHGDEVEYALSRLSIRSDLSGLFILPEDFLRLISFKLTGWKRELVDLMSIRDPMYRFQREETQVAGSIQKPVGVLYPFPEKDYYATELGKYSLDYIFTTNQTVSALNDDNANIATGNLFVLNSQTDDDEDGTYLTNASGIAPTKLSDQHEVITILTFSSLPAYVVGEKVTQATSGASGRIILTDSTNKKIVIANSSASSGTNFNTSNVVTGASSAATGTPSAQGNFTKGNMPLTAIEFFRGASASDTVERFVFVPKLIIEECPDTLEDAVIWHCAGRILEAMGEQALAGTMYQRADLEATTFKRGMKGES